MRLFARAGALLATMVAAATLAGCSSGRSAPDFTLTDHSGAPWSLSAQRGTAVVLTFGYTHCTDTCPLILGKLSRAVNDLGDAKRRVTVAFVTVDPNRDTPAVLKEYLAHFGSSRFIGLTGSPQQIEAVEQAYHVWAQRVPGNHSGRDDYDDDHSSVVYFIDANGHIEGVRDDGDSLDQLAGAMHQLVG